MVPATEKQDLYERGTEALRDGDTRTALDCFSQLIALDRKPVNCSLLAYCLAKEKREVDKAVSLCMEAIKEEPKNPLHFLFLGRIHLLAGLKKEAIRSFRLGLRHGTNKEIINELNRLGARKAPVLPFLKREHPLNKSLGIMLRKLGLR